MSTTYKIRGNNVQFPERCPHCFAGADEMCKTRKGERANRIHNGRAVKMIWDESEERAREHDMAVGPHTSAARRCESCGSSMPGRMARQRDSRGLLVCDSCKNNGFARWNMTYAQRALSPEVLQEFQRREAEALASLTRVAAEQSGRRTAKVPDRFWEKANSDRSQRRLMEAGKNPDRPVCAACGSSLNPETAKKVAITDGGETALHPDDVKPGDYEDAGWMGGWDLGPECSRMFSSKVLAPHHSKTAASADLVSQLLDMESGSNKSFDIGDLHYVVYFDSDTARGDSGAPVHGDISGQYEVWHTDPQESLDSFKIVLRQHVSPGKPGGMQQRYAAEQAARAMTTRSMSMAPRQSSMQVEAHDSGDGATIFHCPFCGSGAVSGGFDGTVSCEFCKQHFTVQVQPEFHAMPQTVDGQPFNVPGMPGGGPDAGAAPEEERAQQEDAQQGQPGQPKAPVDQGGQDKPPVPDPDNASPPVQAMMLVEGVALPVDKALQHFALAHANDRDGVLAQVRAENA